MSDVIVLANVSNRVASLYTSPAALYQGKTSHRLDKKLGGLRPVEETSLLRRYFKMGKRHYPVELSTAFAAGVLFIVSILALAITIN